MPDVDLDYLAAQNARILEELQALRQEVAALKAASGQTLASTRRNDPRRPNDVIR